MAPPVVLWSRFPPPEGGVTVSANRMVHALADRGELGGVVDLGDARSWANGLGRRYRHLLWCSTPQSAWLHALLARGMRGERNLFVHGGDLTRPARTMPMGRPFDTVFATNEVLAAALVRRGLGRQVVVASAWVPAPKARVVERHKGSGPRADGRRILVGVGPTRRWYGLGVAIETVRRLRERGDDDATLTVLGPAPELAVPGLPDWISAAGPVPDVEVAEVLAHHDVLLRPSLVDGDSLLVREALHTGLRVVASDVVPRPAGVELAELRPEALAEAIAGGGRHSDGRGTGPPVLDLL